MRTSRHTTISVTILLAVPRPEHDVLLSGLPTPDSDLATAAQHKLRLICEDLELTAEDHLVEIGTGWGGMAIFAAEHYGCRVTTTTISREQFDYTVAPGFEQRVAGSHHGALR
ncbi:MAG: hypothetical protein CM15mP74_15230 [Halieaceae bacterium]|nr:MAG: hypothetical protein CM15mP74_15230 [Halieaceae bacterium]